MKKAMSWMMIAWIVALAALLVMLVIPTYASNAYKSIEKLFKFGSDDEDEVKFQNLPTHMDLFNKAMRDPDRIAPRDVERADLEKIIDTMTIVQEMTTGGQKVYLLESKVGDKKVYTLFSREKYNGQLMMLEKSFDIEDDYTYSYGEAFYAGDPDDEGQGANEGPYPLEWNADWDPTRNLFNFDKDISTTMDQYCEIGFCMPDALNDKLAELKI